MKTHRSNNTGQAALEFLVVTPVLIFSVSLVGFCGYAIGVKAWLDFKTEKALICVATGESRCLEKWRTDVEDIPGLETKRSALIAGTSHAQAKLQMKWLGKWEWNYQRSLNTKLVKQAAKPAL